MGRYFSKGPTVKEDEVINAFKQWAYPLKSKADLEPLFQRIGDARIVLLGEASHGTHEYYTWRAYITRRLIEDHGFSFMAVEGDWPDCYRLNRFIKGYDQDNKSAFRVLQQFNRWPTWMWANWETVALADWLLEYNRHQPINKKIGFYGLDVYSLRESMDYILQYLEKNDSSALEAARKAFECFEPYNRDEGHSYARAAQLVPELCREEVVAMLRKIRQRMEQYNTDHENVFSVEQNAMVSVNAEDYYRTMIKGGPQSWNKRDRHMADTLDRLLAFHGPHLKAVIWAHNTHVGDARATDMIDEGMYTLGELCRLEHQEKGVVLVGFGSYKGTVMAGRAWGSAMQEMDLPAARPGSIEYLLHKAGAGNQLLMMEDYFDNEVLMQNHIGHRAVGVVYNPLIEQYGNYVPTLLPLRYNLFIHLDETQALKPLHVQASSEMVPETYPFGI